MRADIHDGPEHNTLQSEAGYIDARPHLPGWRNLLQRAAGPYMRVTSDRSRPSSAASAVNSKADAHEPTPAYAVRNTGAGGCDGRINANAIWMMPPASPSATPMR